MDGFFKRLPNVRSAFAVFWYLRVASKTKCFSQEQESFLSDVFITLVAHITCVRESFYLFILLTCLLFLTSYHCRDLDIAHSPQEDPHRENYYSWYDEVNNFNALIMVVLVVL